MPPAAESLEAQKIIIIHPGSLYLRIGRASDLNCYRILHVIARRRKVGGKFHRDSVLPMQIEKSKEVISEMEEWRLNVSHTLQACLQSDGKKRYATPPQQISAFNRRSHPVPVQEPRFQFLQTTADFIVGDDVLSLDPKDPWNIHFPWRRGDFNLHKNVGGSLTAVISDLQQIWLSVLQCILGISANELPNYKAVLVVPDIYNRTNLKELTNLLLNKMKFSACFLIQDSVAGTFGAGLAYACVVDVGDQKTSISCVDDGISQPATRVRLPFGGADITQCYYWLLKKCGFPFKECNDTVQRDAMLLHSLKETNCHLDLNLCGSIERYFKIYPCNQLPLQYTIQCGDESLVAPLSVFHPELLGITGRKKAQAIIQKTSAINPDPEDPFDAEYLRETGRRGAKEQIEQSMNDASGMNTGEPNEEEMVVEPELEKENKSKEFILPPGQMIGLDTAILQSIERCPNDEMKRKMYSCILIIGGGLKFTGIDKWLQNRIAMQTPYAYRSETLDIITSPKDMDSANTAWKGAAIISCLDSAPELWITSTEWQKHGLKVLREKAMFMW
uniref:Actin-related protein 8 n=1 Tax=Culicoides sonorensis TaxID=179676 RepID=A0A336MA12_CULSO